MTITRDEALEAFAQFDPEIYCMSNDEIEQEKQRTYLQNRSMHKWIKQVADELRRQKVDMRDFVSGPIYADEDLVKEKIWKKILHDVYGKDSTTEQTTVETTEIYDTLNKLFGEGVGGRCEPFHIPWPSKEELMMREYEK